MSVPRIVDNRPLPTFGPALNYLHHHGRWEFLLTIGPNFDGERVMLEEFSTLAAAVPRFDAEVEAFKRTLRDQRKADRAQHD